MTRKLLLTSVFALLCCSIAAGPAVAAPGDPDTSFGSGGTVPIEPPGFDATRWAAIGAAPGPDGSTYVGESALDCDEGTAPKFRNCRNQVFVARYLSDGSRDPSFGTREGFAVAVDEPDLSGPGTMAVDSEGRVLVAQASNPYETKGMVVVRLDASGRLDPSFGAGGRVALPCACAFESTKLLLDGEGRIVVFGVRIEIDPSSKPSPRGESIHLARLLADGSTDTSFGTGGATSMRGFDSRSAAVRQNGSIVMPAFRRGRGSFFVRVSANGRGIDRQFNSSRAVRGRKFGTVRALSRNRVAVLGTQASGTRSVLIRLRGDGSIDRRFRRNGVVRPNFSVSDFAVDRHGRLLLAGTTAERGLGGPAEGRGVLRRLRANGRYDARFRNGLHGQSISTELMPEVFYNGNRPMTFHWSSFVPECRAYCRPDPSLRRFLG